MKTVYVIGAGASAEVGLPIGEELKKKISTLLNFRFGRFDSFENGDKKIFEALKLHTGDTNKLKPFMNAAWRITDALPLDSSIDNFIDKHRDNEKIALCGKLAIVRSILEAGKKSELSQEIKTFTEGTDPNSSEINEIRSHMAQAYRLVFLGFAFHKRNMQLISPINEARGKWVDCYATIYDVSHWNQNIIEGQIKNLYPSSDNFGTRIEVSDSTCGTFFTDFSKSLSF